MRSILFVVLDSMREDIFHQEGGYELMDHQADRCYACSNYTLPSHGSMFSGQLPSESGVHSYNPNYTQIEDSAVTNSIPHTTYCVSTNNGFLSEEYGFDVLFDHHTSFSGDSVTDPEGEDPLSYVDNTTEFLKECIRGETIPSLKNAAKLKVNDLLQGRPIPRVGDYGTSATMGVYENPEEPYFLFMNLVETHGPFEETFSSGVNVPSSWTSRDADMWGICNGDIDEYNEFIDNFEKLYRDRTRYVIDKLKSYIQRMEAKTDELVTIITADHGESFRANGVIGHRDLLTPVCRVPFGIRNCSAELGTISHVQIPAIVENVATGPIAVDTGTARAEMVGHILPPDENTEYWDRCARVVYCDDIAYRWDNLGKREKVELNGVHEDSTQIDEIPHKYQFDREFPERDQKVVEGSIRRRLSDLGYV